MELEIKVGGLYRMRNGDVARVASGSVDEGGFEVTYIDSNLDCYIFDVLPDGLVYEGGPDDTDDLIEVYRTTSLPKTGQIWAAMVGGELTPVLIDADRVRAITGDYYICRVINPRLRKLKDRGSIPTADLLWEITDVNEPYDPRQNWGVQSKHPEPEKEKAYQARDERLFEEDTPQVAVKEDTPQVAVKEDMRQTTERFVKHDLGKPRMGLIPPLAEVEVARVLTYGADKYSADNWKNVPEDERYRYMDSTLRHINSYRSGELTDPESGLPHLAHAICSLLFLLEFQSAN